MPGGMVQVVLVENGAWRRAGLKNGTATGPKKRTMLDSPTLILSLDGQEM
jgi:hypothetical protein